MAVFTETIKLEDQVTPVAKTASASVAGVSKVMGGLSKATFDAANAMKVGKESIGVAITGIKDAFTSLAAGDVKGAIAGVTDAVAGIAKMLDLVVPGLGEAVSAIVSIVGGMVGITVGLVQSGIELAISASQARDKMRGLFDVLGEGKVSGDETIKMLEQLGEQTGMTKDQLAPFAQKFLAMGVTGVDQLRQLTLAAASAGAMAEGGAEKFETMFKKISAATATGQALKIPLKGLGSLADMGLTVDDVAKKMGVSAQKLGADLKSGAVDAGKFGSAMQDALVEKGAGPLEDLGLTMGSLKARFTEAITKMFELPQVKAFMKEVKSLFGIFDEKAPSAQAMTAGIQGVFGKILETLTKVVPVAKHFFLDMIIYGLKAYLAVKPIVKAIDDFRKSATGVAIINGALSALWEIVKVVAISIGVVVVIALALWAAMVVVSTVVWSLIAGFVSLMADGIQVTIDGFVELGGYISDFVSGAATAIAEWVDGAATAASDFISGLVSGIAAGAAKVVGAVSGLAKSALNAFTGSDGIDAHSPSVKMMKAGGHMTDGLVEGIGAGTPDVHGASSGMAQAGVDGATAAAKGGAGAGGGGSTTINVSVQIDGAGKSAIELTQEMVAQVFERAALAAGV